MNSSSNSDIKRKSRASIKHHRNRRNRRIRRAKERAQESGNQNRLLKDSSWGNSDSNNILNLDETAPLNSNLEQLLTPSPPPVSELDQFKSLSPNYSPISNPNLLENSPPPSPSYSTTSSVEFLQEIPNNSSLFTQADLEELPFLRLVSQFPQCTRPLPPGTYTVGPNEINLSELRSIILIAPLDYRLVVS